MTMKPIPLPGRVAPADACLAHLSLRGANQFIGVLTDMFPRISARFQENQYGECWLEINHILTRDYIFKLDAFTSDSMHRALILADLVNQGYLVTARDFLDGWVG